MGIRSMNYIAISADVARIPVPLALAKNIEISDERGDLFVFESNFTPMWARDEKGVECTFDLEEEVAIHRFLGSLPKDSFMMTRAGEEFGKRGGWIDHPFKNEESVAAIEKDYAAGTEEF